MTDYSETIFALRDSDDKIRYVGRTRFRDLDRKLANMRAHRNSRSNAVSRFLRDTPSASIDELEYLALGDPRNEPSHKAKWIRRLTLQGCDLLNIRRS